MIRCCLLLLFAALMYAPAAAQHTRPLAGSYRLNQNHEPEGGTQLFLLPDSSYAILYFGGARAGRWSVAADTLLYLHPTDVPALPLALYGRRHDGLGGRTRIFYAGFDEGGAVLGGRGERRGALPLLRPVLNADANCVPFPLVDTFAGLPDSLYFVLPPAAEEGPAQRYAFAACPGCNDFVAVLSARRSDDFLQQQEPFAAIRKGGLYLLGAGRMLKAGPLPAREEDLALFRMLKAHNPEPDSLLYNPRYRATDDGEGGRFSTAGYAEAPGRDLLFLREGYEPGAEYRTDYDYHDMRVLYRFRRLAPSVREGGGFAQEEAPVFRASCE